MPNFLTSGFVFAVAALRDMEALQINPQDTRAPFDDAFANGQFKGNKLDYVALVPGRSDGLHRPHHVSRGAAFILAGEAVPPPTSPWVT